MIKFLRRTGLLVLILILLTVGLIWFFANSLIKTAVEKGGSSAVGAKVELGSASVNWAPFGIELNNLLISNPDKPMENMLAMNSIHGQVQMLPLLAGQIIVNDLSATGVEFNTARTSSGAITKTEKPEKSDKPVVDLNALKEKLPSAEEIIAREPMTTPQKATALKATVEQSQSDIKQQINNLPDDSKLKDYETRLKAATTGDIKSLDDLQKRKTELEKIKNEIRQDKANLEKARDSVKTAKNQLDADYTALKNAPKEDMAKIRERYSFDATGASNLTRLLFGDQAQEWFNNLQTWYTRLQAIMPKAGDDTSGESAKSDSQLFAFAYDKTLPSFLVRHAQLAAVLPIGDIDVTLNDITHQPHILGKPLTLKAVGEKLPSASSLSVNGIINHVNPNKATDQLDWSIKDWQLSQLTLSKSKTMPITLDKSATNVTGNLNIENKALKGGFNADFNAAQWQVSESKGIEGQVAQTLKGIDNFTLQGEIKGSVSSPSFTLSSDLDDQLKKVASKQLKTKQAEVEKKVKSYLDQEVSKASGPYEKQLSLLNKTDGSVNQRLSQLEEMLKSEVKSAVNKQKEVLQDKAEDKAKDKLKGLKF